MRDTQFLAHVRRNEHGSFGVHHLEEHLRAVGSLAGEFASVVDSSDQPILGYDRCWTW